MKMSTSNWAAKFRVGIVGAIASVTVACGGSPVSQAKANEKDGPGGSGSAKSTELERVLERIMAPPQIRTEQGFAARLLIAPGELYDPQFMRTQGDTVWIDDDGGQNPEKEGQGRIMAIDGEGNVSTVLEIGRILPPISFDIAPASFGPYGGQIFLLTQSEIGGAGAFKGFIVQRVDATTQRNAEMFCTLPPAGGPDGKAIPAWGGDAHFGPVGSPFAGKFFAAAGANGTVYQVTSDGRCVPFVIFDTQKWGHPLGMAFSLDGQHMLVSMVMPPKGKATIARVRPDGTVEPEQLVRTSPDKEINFWAMAYAPPGFGDYAGQLFIAANNEKVFLGQDKHRTHTVPAAGEVYRLTPKGELKLVASGLHIAFGLHFVRNRLWVSDINGDYMIWAAREAPDGFVVEITPTP